MIGYSWQGYALIALGSAAGGVVRLVVAGRIDRCAGAALPWGTLAVNVTGCLAIGVLGVVGAGSTALAGPGFWPLVVTGFLGSYTTVSAFSLQTYVLLRARRPAAAGYIALSVALCLGAATIGALFASGLGLGATS